STARSFVSAAARAPSLRSPTAALPRLRPSPSSLPGRRSSFSLPSRYLKRLRVYNASVHASVTLKCVRDPKKKS
ncbi:hypothetical protein HID58_025055, partial [Brassica napus]